VANRVEYDIAGVVLEYSRTGTLFPPYPVVDLLDHIFLCLFRTCRNTAIAAMSSVKSREFPDVKVN